jgi:ATP-dependent helicase/DNAse subunit B
LAEIITCEDFPVVIRKFILSGLLETEQEEEIKKIIQEVLSHPRLKKYFSKEVRVYNEQEIVFEGNFYRPDRLVEEGNILTVIDFKTGEKTPGHKKQMETYVKALQAFGKDVETKLLVYVSPQSVEIVSL